jgi:hypothetical protein
LDGARKPIDQFKVVLVQFDLDFEMMPGNSAGG